MTILVTGATGNVGRHVVHQLVQSGQQVRALTRNPAKAKEVLPKGVEVVYGDLAAPETLTSVMAGVKGIYLMTSSGGGTPLQTGDEIIDLAMKAGVERVAILWSGVKGTVEQAAEASDLEWTHIQPYCEFMSNTLSWAESIRTASVVQEPFANYLNAIVHEADVAAVAVAALTKTGHAGKTYTLTGPEALTPRDKVNVIAAALKRDIRFDELTKQQARERLKQTGVSNEMIDYVHNWHENLPKEAFTVVPTVKDVTGQDARTFAQWVAEHLRVFS
ncbi:NmrA family NAD(P)-binding protein [Paenibacillus nasutitermitis]|uniref:Nucleotide-diphosphate-sugar epimerase n=1 Tax=Paenibacillus nasutitermitis TaxID=1652958 RepID=A0A917DP14_9BACL|nr:NAD(P)H-binding protein [Paenibacillus nasutitermitis]GGD52879.1 nucleotide-diphosphate-sugar epimerase [Paenibacillus nasutitermitis]